MFNVRDYYKIISDIKHIYFILYINILFESYYNISKCNKYRKIFTYTSTSKYAQYIKTRYKRLLLIIHRFS